MVINSLVLVQFVSLVDQWKIVPIRLWIYYCAINANIAFTCFRYKKPMNSLIILLLMCLPSSIHLRTMLAEPWPCTSNFPSATPIYLNNNDDDIRYIKGCLTNASFPNEIVTSMGIDCSSNQNLMEELPENFISYLAHLKELVIGDCSVEDVWANNFLHLASITSLDLSGNQLQSISIGVFSPIPSLMYLNLSGNAIVFIEDNAFSGLPRLADLDLSFNQLDYISPKWFDMATSKSIEEFYFNNNVLKEIPEGIFKGWTKTYAFNFNYNQIVRIHRRAFESSEIINYLTLHHNNLTNINPKAFRNNVIIEQLDVSGNFLVNDLPLDFFKKSKLKHIWIYANPFECTCLRGLENALETRRIEVMKVQPKSIIAEGIKCGNNDGSSIPVCGVSDESSHVCNESEDAELIVSRINNHIRKMGFDDLRNWYEQCAELPKIAYIETE